VSPNFGLQLPSEPLLRLGVRIPFEWVRVFGEHGKHARTAVGVAALPLNLPVIMSAEVIVTR
jgi:hypothetical protein